MSVRYVIVDMYTFADGRPYGVLRVAGPQRRGLAPVATMHRRYWSIDEAQAEVQRLRAIDRQRSATGSPKA